MVKRRKRIKFKNIGIVLGVVILLIIIIISLASKKEEKIVLKEDYSGMTLTEIEQYAKDNKAHIKKDYKKSTKYEKGEVIDAKLDNGVIAITVSEGDYDDSYYQKFNVNELGKVPIMMYHSIVDTEENKYTGGNVDKDGYNRTAKAFREDLEFYYKNKYVMIRLNDYINGIIDVPIGYSPIILTFDDGNEDNAKVIKKNSDGSLEFDPNSAIGILEEFKKKYPDFQVTATFFVMQNIFNQSKYNQDIVNWMVDNGYDIGNHTISHPDFTKISEEASIKQVGLMYKNLDDLLGDKYVHIIALPFGSPYKKSHANYKHILEGNYEGYDYKSDAALRVGWEPEVSPFNKNFDKEFLKRCRAYDNNGKEFDIQMVFKMLEKSRYISDGDKERVMIPESAKENINSELTNVKTYKEGK